MPIRSADLNQGIGSNFLKIRKLVDKRIRHELHVSSLKTYLLANTAPRGLRLMVKPSMTNFSNTEIQEWNKILNHATIELTKVTVQHCERTLTSLKNQERYLKNNFPLSESETIELDAFEQKKRVDVESTKKKKIRPR